MDYTIFSDYRGRGYDLLKSGFKFFHNRIDNQLEANVENELDQS